MEFQASAFTIWKTEKIARLQIQHGKSTHADQWGEVCEGFVELESDVSRRQKLPLHWFFWL